MLEIGNIVKFKKSEFFPENMKFVIAEVTSDGYIIMNMDNGAKSGFWNEDELDLLDTGDPVFVKTLAAIWEKQVSDQKTIKWIKENWNGELELNWNSISFLYSKINYNVAVSTGEEFKFYWYVLYPIFKEIFFGTKRKALKETKKAFGDRSKEFMYRVTKLYDEVNNEQD